MINIFRKYHIIRNFPKNYALHKKIFANIVYFFTGIIVHPRKNSLNHKDLVKARLLLRRGDIVLFGNLRETSSLFIGSPLTHASLYVGFHRFIEAVGDGVRISSLHHMFTNYDTMTILRLPQKTPYRKRKIRKAINFAKMQIGKPYDYDFSASEKSFFCTELVNDAYKHAGHKTGLRTVGRFSTFFEKIEKKISKAIKALHPVRMLTGNFEIVFMSHNLKWEKKKLSYIKK